MRSARFQLIITAMFFAIAAQAADFWLPRGFTNETPIVNGRTVWLAVLSGDAQSQTNIQKLVGSQVGFAGYAYALQFGNANLWVNSNIVVEVEIRPPQDVNRNVYHARQISAEVLGILKSVDFEKRVIHIQAKPEDWKITGAN
jgi:hypothetical protein